MRKRLSRVLLVVGICLSLMTISAFAQGKSGDKGKGAGKSAAVQHDNGKDKGKSEIKIKDDKDKDKDKGKSKDHSRSHIGWDPRGPDDRPPGWDHGNKRGWGDCNVPPGLAKKRGCDRFGYSRRERDVITKIRQRGGTIVIAGEDKKDEKKEESIFTKASREAERRKAEEQAKKKQ